MTGSMALSIRGKTLHVSDRVWVPALALSLAVFRVFSFVHNLGIQEVFHDIDRFLEIGAGRGIPYRDYAVEYPPLTVAMLKLLAWAAPGRTAFGAAIFVVAAVCELVIAATLWRVWGRAAAFYFLVADSFLISLLFARLDLVSAMLVTLAAACALRRRPVSAALLITAAIGVKLWPLPVALILLRIHDRGDRRRYLIALLTAAVLLGAGWLALGGVTAITDVVTFRGAHGWQIESAGGAAIRLVTQEPQYFETGAHRFGHVPPGLGLVMIVVSALIAIWAAWRSPGRLGEAWIAGVGAMLLGSTLLSPQFIVWLLPAAAIGWRRGGRLLGCVVVLTALFTDWESQWYGHLLNGDLSGMLVVNVRNALLLGVVVLAVRHLSREDAAPASP